MVECPPLVVEDELDQHQHQRPGKNNFATYGLSSLVQSCKNSGSSSDRISTYHRWHRRAARPRPWLRTHSLPSNDQTRPSSSDEFEVV